MKISGFTMVRNAVKLYFPIKESIQSILPLVDEFVVALGNSDDDTEAVIKSINSNKIKIIHRIWDEKLYKDGIIFAYETNVALNACSGDWCFYLQADEVVHEKDLLIIEKACNRYLNQKTIDGFLFKYYHFWGDYQHYLPFHGWYRNEIRIVRNNAGIYSYKDAQSFRKGNNEKLNVIEIDAHIYHYGWVRPPYLMQKKKNVQDAIHQGQNSIKEQEAVFSYGNMLRIPVFKGSHPKVMEQRIKQFNWGNELLFKSHKLNRPLFKHEKTKYRLISAVENLFGGKQWFGYKNWKKVGQFSL